MKLKALTLPISLSLFSLLSIACPAQAEPDAPYGLLCELLRDPGQALITDSNPEFSWIVNDKRRNACQTAFHILVASSYDNIQKDRGNMWDSGKTSSDRSINIEYRGKPLESYTNYWWKVKTWDIFGKPGPFSKPQAFITGNFQQLKRKWPAESKWIQMENGGWFLENRQKASFHEIPPEKITQNSESDYFVDFGKAAFTTLRVTLTSQIEGNKVTVFLGERKTGNNRVHKKPGKTNIGFKKIEITLKKGKHSYTIELPRHISHYPNSQVLPEHILEVVPYRYAEIVGSHSKIESGDIRQIALFYYFDDDASSFTSSNSNLNKVWELCKYTLKATPFLSLYADGNRERMPYEADAYIQQLGHYSVDREFSIGRYTHHFLIFNPAWPTEWHMHTVFMAWADYMHTGNTESIETFYDEIKKKTLTALAREDGLISTKTGLVTKEFLKSLHYTGNQFADIVDWPPGSPPGEKNLPTYHGPSVNGERDGYVFRPINTVVNAFHYRSLVLMAEMAEAVGKSEDAKFFADRAAKVKDSFNRLLFDEKRGIYVDGVGTEHSTLHANMFPLAFGLVPEERIPTVVRYMKSKGMVCSVYGAQYFLEALYRAGESQYALDLMTSESVRSWMNMIRVGSTMTTEAWDERYKPNLTWNHAWGSAPANIIPGKLFGIEPIKPGFRKVRIKPQPGSLTSAEIKMPCIRGTIFCRWEKKSKHYLFEVTIPANTKAVIWLPSQSRENLKESGVKITKCEDIKVIGEKEGFVLCETGSGHYSFSKEFDPIQ
ncbi:MAG: alpha-L-rhamnosidase [Phycisphaerae bacterium]|nr:alpha-L-rhamnosidase [Phycisphaerae bacterium]